MGPIIGLKTNTTGTLTRGRWRATRLQKYAKSPLSFPRVRNGLWQMSCIYVLNWVFLFILSTVVTQNDWSKIYSFVRFTHRRKLNFINVFLGCICRLCKRSKSMISQVNQLYLSICFLKISAQFSGMHLFYLNQVFEIPRFNNYPSWCKIQFRSWVKHTWISRKLKPLWNTGSFNGSALREFVSSCSMWKHQCFKPFFMTRLIL